MDLYIEKVHIFDDNRLTEILLVIYENVMNFLYIDSNVFLLRPVNFLEDVECFDKCTMSNTGSD